MVNIFDVAAYILSKGRPMTAMKMQKLLYYSQAWSLVWDDAPLFDSQFEAWANGPVAPEFFSAHQGEFIVSSEPRGNSQNLTKSQRETVNAVLKTYGDKTPQWLSDRTHREKPWIDARVGLADGVRGNRTISQSSMSEYYGSL
jgi:uncharacterized phage-associated protein